MRALALLLMAAAAPTPQQGSTHLQYRRALVLPGATSGQACLSLPPDLFPHAAQHLQDLRIYQGEREVPYAVRTDVQARTEPVVQQVTNLGTVEGSTTFEAAAPAGKYDELTLDVAAQNFIATVTVSGTHGEAGSVPVTLGSYTIFDLSHQGLGRSTVLHLPTATFQQLRFRIHGTLKPADIGGIRFQQNTSAAEVPFITVLAGGAMRQDGHTSVLDVTVPAHVPLDRIHVVPASTAPAAFNRDITATATPVEVRARETSEELVPLHYSGTLQRVHRVQRDQRVDVENLDLPVDGSPAETAVTWHIVVDNGDDVPLPLAGVALQMRERQVCFDVNQGGAPYLLYYGDMRRTAPVYDYQRLFSPAPSPMHAALGPEQRNPGYTPAADDRPLSERHPALLWGGLLLTVAVLGTVALRSAADATAPLK